MPVDGRHDVLQGSHDPVEEIEWGERKILQGNEIPFPVFGLVLEKH
jgi:hypothetical protein